MAFLVDTNVLVYAFDPRAPAKRRVAQRLISDGIESGEARIAHQAIVEFVNATRKQGRGGPLLTDDEARREAELLLSQIPVLYPDAALLRLAIRGWATYGLGWFDAHMWAYAEQAGLSVLYSEDFQHQRMYGSVVVINPFAALASNAR